MPGRFFFLCAIFLMAFDQPRLVKTKVADGMTVMIPKEWRPMDDLDFSQRYPSVRAPLAAFTNQDRTVDFSINISATQWRRGDEAVAQQFFKASLRNMFDRVEMLHEGVEEIKGRKYIFFEFESRINGSREDEAIRSPILKYSYVQYLITPGRTLVFSFNSPVRERETWQDIAQTMMKSIRIK